MNQNFEYKGYLGSIEADLEEDFLFGKLMFIRDIVSYNAADLRSLKKAFEEAVDSYLSTCEEIGDLPETPCKGSFNVRVGPELHQQIALSAGKASISLNEWIRIACVSKLKGENPISAMEKTTITRIEAEFDDGVYEITESSKEWQFQNPPQILRH